MPKGIIEIQLIAHKVFNFIVLLFILKKSHNVYVGNNILKYISIDKELNSIIFILDIISDIIE